MTHFHYMDITGEVFRLTLDLADLERIPWEEWANKGLEIQTWREGDGWIFGGTLIGKQFADLEFLGSVEA